MTIIRLLGLLGLFSIPILSAAQVYMSDQGMYENEQYSMFIEKSYAIHINKSIQGTGALVHDGGIIYLITAKHVLFDSVSKLKFPHHELRAYNMLGDGRTPSVEFAISPETLKAHDDVNNDVAAIALGVWVDSTSIDLFPGVEYFNDGKGANIISGDDYAFDEDVMIGADAFTVGYPQDLISTNRAFNFPLLIRGNIAGFTSRDQHPVVAMPVFGGNSGGPVYQRRVFVGPGGKRTYTVELIGIAVEFVAAKPKFAEYELKAGPADSTFYAPWLNSGYTIVEPLEAIQKLLKPTSRKYNANRAPSEKP